MAINNTKVLNNNDMLTYHGHHLQHAPVIDLALSNSLLALQFDISPVKVHTKDHYGGDHYPISVSLHPSQDHNTLDKNDNPSHLPSLWEGKK